MGYYDKTNFHRLVKDFCLQGGDPSGTGSGGQSIFGKAFEDEFNPNLKHKIGSLSMANSGPSSNRSQFFICLS
jgi:cyclophilin family peptidyl-prolyl cis-trans isomerase